MNAPLTDTEQRQAKPVDLIVQKFQEAMIKLEKRKEMVKMTRQKLRDYIKKETKNT